LFLVVLGPAIIARRTVFVIPAKAGLAWEACKVKLDSGLRWNDDYE